MTKIWLKKLAEYVCIFLAVSVLIFFMIHWFSPTDPISVIIGGKGSTPEIIENAREKFHLNEPVWKQYLIWISGILHGDWGTSYKFQTPVLETIAARAPITAGLVIGASVISLIVSIPLGVACAVKNDSPFDRAVSVLSLVLAAVPPFLFSIVLLVIIVSINPSYPIAGGYEGIGGYIERMAAPCIALACSKMTITLKVTRQGMIEQLKSPYMMNLRAKGMPLGTQVWKHGLKNAIIPVISILSIQIGAMVVGAVLVESVFSLSGVGSLLIDSINASDYPVVQAIIMMLVLIFMITSAVADILCRIIDPRIRTKP